MLSQMREGEEEGGGTLPSHQCGEWVVGGRVRGAEWVSLMNLTEYTDVYSTCKNTQLMYKNVHSERQQASDYSALSYSPGNSFL